MIAPLHIQQIGVYTVVEFRTPSLMDPAVIDSIGEALFHLVDEQDRRMLVLDFEQVQYLSSQALGVVITLNKKLRALKKSKLVLCSVGPTLMELLKITRLDKVLTIKSSQQEALA